jgi:D-3-phosphoglycerate dehydrogenase / 2-oxoglutarate reductase
MNEEILAMVSPEQWGDVDPRSRTMLEEAGIEFVRNTQRRLLVESEMKELIKGCNVAISGAEPMTAAVMDEAPDLKFVARCAVGLDSIDLMAARERGVGVSYVPGANAQAVAELTISHILTLIRGVQRGDALLRKGEWFRVMGRNLDELTIGIIGVGKIGKRVARHLSAFGARIIANDLAPDEDFGAPLRIDWVSKDRLFKDADVVCLHVPKAPSTLNLVGREQLAMMKDSAFLINTARGGLIDEAALADALRAGKIAGAGLDVFGEEPYRGELAGLENILMTCHMGANTRSSRARMEIQAAECLIAYLRGEPVPNLVPDSEYELQVQMKALVDQT